MIAYIATESTITVILNGQNRTIQVKSKVHRNDVIKALERYKASNQTQADKEALEIFLAPIKRVVLESDHRFELDTDEKKLYLKGTKQAIPAGLSDKILDFLNNGLKITSLVKFWESCLRNPHYVAIEELFSFLERNNLPITDDGGFLGYKKLNFVNSVSVPENFEELIIDEDGKVKSIYGGEVSESVKKEYLDFINNTNNPLMKDVYSGTIKQRLGEIVRIERVKLGELERRNACGYGLHIGAFSYGFSGNVRVLCKVFPEDVIACNPYEQKLRTCKYQIVSFVDEAKEVKELLVNFSEAESKIANGEYEEDDVFNNPFSEGDIVRAVSDDNEITEGNLYFIVQTDAEDILVINNSGEEEWYDFSLFEAK